MYSFSMMMDLHTLKFVTEEQMDFIQQKWHCCTLCKLHALYLYPRMRIQQRNVQKCIRVYQNGGPYLGRNYKWLFLDQLVRQ